MTGARAAETASGEGVDRALQALFAVVAQARRAEEQEKAPAEETGWRP